MKKSFYQLTKASVSGAIPFDWNTLPDEVINNIKYEDTFMILSLNPDKEFCEKTVIYFKEVKKFSKAVTHQIETDVIVFGV